MRAGGAVSMASKGLGQNYFFLLGDNADPAMADRVKVAMAARHDIAEEVQFDRKDRRVMTPRHAADQRAH
jgi:hypothetical protein